jgi:hypothetical protein
MDWSQAGHILLVWPKHGQVLQRKLDLNLVRHHAITLGSMLALVTIDAEVRFYARQLGIPVFGDLQMAQNADWSMTQPEEFTSRRYSTHAKLEHLNQENLAHSPPWLEHPAIRVLCLSLSVIALFSLAILILPGATITITPQVEIQSMAVDITADPSTAMINYSTGSVPTYRLEAVVEGQESIASSGTIIFADKPAKGKLSFTNISDQELTIPAGTIVSTAGSNPIRFITTSNTEEIIKPDQSVILEAQAMKPGLSGNLPANRLEAIEGDMGAYLSVTNSSPTSGGTQETVSSPSAQDLETLRERLFSRLKQTALEEIQSRLPEGDMIITPTLTISNTIAETSFPGIGEPGNDLKLSMQLKFQAQAISMDTLQHLAEPIMDSYIPEGFLPTAKSIVFSQSSQATLMEDGKAYLTIDAKRKIIADIPGAQVGERITGVPVTQAVERLTTSFPLSERAQISLSPGWWPRLPFLAMRIKVLQTENQ